MANKNVADLVDSSSYNWNHELVRKLYHYPLSEEILQIPLAKTDGGQDRIIWKHSNSGDFQVKKAYDLLHKDYRDSNPTQFRSTDLPKETWPLVWKVKLPVKISTFIGNYYMTACLLNLTSLTEAFLLTITVPCERKRSNHPRTYSWPELFGLFLLSN